MVITGNPKESGADLAVVIVNTWEPLPYPREGLEDVEDLRIFLRAVGRPAPAPRRRPSPDVRRWSREDAGVIASGNAVAPALSACGQVRRDPPRR